MHIWIVNHYAITPDLPGGTRHYDIGRELVRKGHDVTIVAASRHYTTAEETKTYRQGSDFLVETIDGVRFVWVRTMPYRGNGIGRVRNMFEFTYKLRHLPRSGLPRPDVIVGSSVHLFAVYGAYRLSRRFRVPLVMEVRDLWPQTLIDMGVPKYHPFVLLLGRLEPFLYRRADAIVTLLPKAHEHIASFGVPEEKIHWVSNGVNLARFETAAPSHRLDRSKFNVVYAGTLGKANNLEPLIDAFALLDDLPNVRLSFVGDGPARSELMRRAEGIDSIVFMDPVAKSEVAALLLEADVLYVGLKNLRLYRYGMSMNKVFDYMAAAKPVIFAAEVPKNPVALADAGIVVPPENAEAIAKAVRTLYNYTVLQRASMGERARTYVREHFGMDVIASAFESVLKKGINEKN